MKPKNGFIRRKRLTESFQREWMEGFGARTTCPRFLQHAGWQPALPQPTPAVAPDGQQQTSPPRFIYGDGGMTGDDFWKLP
jgi:hypothetical protein